MSAAFCALDQPRIDEMQASLDVIHSTIVHFSDLMAGCADGSVFRTMSCGEVEALADVMKLAGCDDEAALVIADHADYDEPGDDHYTEGGEG